MQEPSPFSVTATSLTLNPVNKGLITWPPCVILWLFLSSQIVIKDFFPTLRTVVFTFCLILGRKGTLPNWDNFPARLHEKISEECFF